MQFTENVVIAISTVAVETQPGDWGTTGVGASCVHRKTNEKMSVSFLSAVTTRTRQTQARRVQSGCGVHVLLPRFNPAAPDGLRELVEASPLKDGPAVLFQVCSLHLDRALERMTALHGAGAPIFVEKCPKGEASTCLFRCCDLSRLLDSVLRDIPLCRVLTRLPFIASVCSHSAAEVAAAFVLACEIAAADAGKVKLSAPTSLRRTLLDAVLRSPVASSLVTTGETLTFQVARCFGAAYFYDSEAVPSWCPSADSLESSLGPSEQHGHWHSANALDKSGAKLSVCRAFYKLSEVFHEEPSFRSALTDAVRGSACIDIGASPGGWTDLLSRHARVVAVDPGDLEAEIACRPSVVHLRRLVGSDADSDDAIRCALRPALAADFVVCDANIAPSDAASLLAHLAASGLLAAGCKVVLTLKAQCKVRGGLQGQCTRRRLESEAVAALGSSFEGVRVRHLFANTQHETTLTALFTGAQHGASEQQRAGTVLSRAIQGQGAA